MGGGKEVVGSGEYAVEVNGNIEGVGLDPEVAII